MAKAVHRQVSSKKPTKRTQSIRPLIYSSDVSKILMKQIHDLCKSHGVLRRELLAGILDVAREVAEMEPDSPVFVGEIK